MQPHQYCKTLILCITSIALLLSIASCTKKNVDPGIELELITDPKMTNVQRVLQWREGADLLLETRDCVTVTVQRPSTHTNTQLTIEQLSTLLASKELGPIKTAVVYAPEEIAAGGSPTEFNERITNALMKGGLKAIMLQTDFHGIPVELRLKNDAR